MSLIYKNKKDMITSVEIQNNNGIIKLEFSKDCGAFGTDEILDRYNLTPERLLEILQSYDDYKEHEI